MRYAFGLVSLLVAVAIIAWLMSMQAPTLKTAAKTREQTKQMAGYDEDGTRAMDSITLDSDSSGSKLTAVVVTDIKPNGAYARYYGLKKGDKIVQVGDQRVRDMNNDGELAKSFVQEAYQLQQQLVVNRNGKEITLPQPKTDTAAADSSPSSDDSAPATPKKKKSDIQSQLDAIQKIPTH